jgi:CRISPR-associated protein Cas5d
MSEDFQIKFEIEGPAAMFMRPDTGSTPISYPAPTFSAAKGMFDAVLRLKSVYVKPLWVEVCKPLRYERYITNYGGPLRKPDQIRKNNNYQLIATILVDVCYRIYGKVVVKRSTRGGGRNGTRIRTDAEKHRKAFIEKFNNRLNNFQNFYIPCLGWKEFTPSYFGPIRENDAAGRPIKEDISVDETIPSMLYAMWENSKLQPTFVQNVRIKRGILSYQEGGGDNV